MRHNKLGMLMLIATVVLFVGCESNQPPNAQAGPDQTVDADERVALYGRASDSAGTVQTYRWEQIAGHPVSLSNANQASASFVAPVVKGSQQVWIHRGGAGSKARIIVETVKPRFPMPEMVVIPAGSFRMGCVSGIDCIDSQKPVHSVRIASFELSKYEVTFEEYDAFTDATGRERADDEGWGRGRRPVINVSWDDAVAYTQWLSEQTGENYRLPSEAEWEYAARAGSTTQYSWGNDIGVNRANCIGCGSQWDGKQTAPVGSFNANRWGLYDMHGNVEEWVQDCWNRNYEGAPDDGSAWESGGCYYRFLRGGSWFVRPWFLGSANRSWLSTLFRYYYIGFRVARSF